MARTVQQIYDAKIAEKNSQATLNSLQPNIDSAQTLLSDLTSTSKVANWRLWLWITSVSDWILETLFDKLKLEVDEIANNLVAATPRWYKTESLKFQYGHQLVYVNDKFQYSVVDENAKIIKRVAVVESSGQVRIKVATLVGSVVTPLDTDQLQAFEVYIKQIKPAGVNTAVISRVADLLKIAYSIYYDPLVPLATVKTNVETTINNYIADLPFNGELVLNDLTAAIDAAVGVVNPVLLLAEAKYGAIPYSTINIKYVADAGHMVIDAAFPLSTQLTYIANV